MAVVIAGTYEIMEKLGSGGGGTVYLARHLRLGKQVVLKADKRRITTRPEFLRREVDILKELSHPYIPNVYDFFVEGETVYTVMDYIQGESLDRPLKRGEVFSQPQVIQWAKELLEALRYLHSPTHGTPPRGFVHSDIKPANLMRTSDNHICLIDFNIALALGEENVVGCSAGYASPEHYGLDYSSGSDTVNPTASTATYDRTAMADTVTLADRGDTTIAHMDTELMTAGRSSSGLSRRAGIMPDVRSDIYSTGATLYHLLCGQRPSKDARAVVPLSKEAFSPQIVRIITKAMNPNPDLRYQTAEEMLWDLQHLRENDVRVRRRKRSRICAGILFTLLFASGSASAFLGLKRMQTTEQWLKLAEYSRQALAQGDPEAAIQYALQALPVEKTSLEPEDVPEVQRTLTKALGVYELKDGYRGHGTLELPSAPLWMRISPDGQTAVCVCQGKLILFDTDKAEVIETLPAAESALAEAEYLDEHRVVYAGQAGVSVYDLQTGQQIWTGKPATAVAISGDGSTMAAIYKEETFATIYDASSGQVLDTIDFEGKCQSVTVNDSFANPCDNLLALNPDGSRLAVSFADGSLLIYDRTDPEDTIILFDETSGYTHFEGGFSQEYLACSASNQSGSLFAVIDTEKKIQTGGFDSAAAFGVQADESGIYVQTDNLLVKIHPVTGEQTPLVTTSEKIQRFARSGDHTIITTQDEIQIFNEYAAPVASQKKEHDSDFVQIQNGCVLNGSSDSPQIQIMRYEHHPEAEVFSYDPNIAHDEARISADGKTVMLFSYDRFHLFAVDGTKLAETDIPDAGQVYDQQYVREGNTSRLEVIYNDGTVAAYSGQDGSLLYKKAGEPKDKSLYEEFVTDRYRIQSPLHGTPEAYDRETGRLAFRLDEDAYLTYVTQAGPYLVVQFVTADGEAYGQLLNERGQILADLPNLCDVVGDRLFFDDPTGNMREARIYNKNELVELARKKEGGRE
ncbi:MAG: WD40 repeat domain-containing serine/threonine protein kinase [Eubacteriales bacterium]|nr:WD40 repeat domain-containing serine/threonine protein kinase [Eubacteriales bacterium]